MQSTKPLLLAVTLLVTALAGCAGDDGPLNASFVATPLDADKSRFRFDASASTGSDLKYSWDFGDRSEPQSGRTIEHTYEYPNGEYRVTLTVTDGTGARKTVTQPVLTGNGQNEPPLLYLTVDKRRVLANESIFFDGSQSVDPDGDPLFFRWDFNSQLDDQSLKNMENLGHQAYGRYPDGKPAPASNGSAGNGSEPEPETGFTPSGHDWQQEVGEARQRLIERILGGGFHGGGEGNSEPRNTEFDGKVNDTSPVQFFQYPSTAVYYVHVRVEDIKGAGQEGFIKISVDNTVPPATNSTPFTGELQPGVLGQVADLSSDERTRRSHERSFRYEHPGTTTVSLQFTPTPSSASAQVGVYICGTGTLQECRNNPAAKKLEPGPSGRTMTYTIGPGETMPSTYKVFIVNGDQSQAQVQYTVRLDTVFDLNPWAAEESGKGGAHH